MAKIDRPTAFPDGTTGTPPLRSSKGPGTSGLWGVVGGGDGSKASPPGEQRTNTGAYPQIAARSSFLDITTMSIALVALAAFIVPQYLRIKNNAHLATIQSDLRSLVSAEESYYSDYHTYTTTLPASRYAPSDGVTVVVDTADATGWHASASSRYLKRAHAGVTGCHIAVGVASVEDETEGSPVCP